MKINEEMNDAVKAVHGGKVENGGDGLPWRFQWDPGGTFSPQIRFPVIHGKNMRLITG